MATSANSTHVIFDDGTTQTTAGSRSSIFSSSPTNVNRFTSPGTYTKPGGLRRVKVTVVGGGGGGGKALNDFYAGGGGGGGGGTVIGWIPGPEVPPSVTVTVGSGGPSPRLDIVGVPGGTSSFGTLLSATGGTGGGHPQPSPACFFRGGAGGVGVAPGTPTNVTALTIKGGGGGMGTYGPLVGFDAGGGGIGGSSHLGGGGAGGTTPSDHHYGSFFGGGGGGGFNYQNAYITPPIYLSGGDGAQGIVIVEEFI